jgi:hypothetical protein
MKHPPASVQVTSTPFTTINTETNAGPASVVMLGMASDDKFSLLLAVGSTDLILSVHKSPIMSHVRLLLSSGDEQFSVSLCLNSRQASPKAQQSHFHGFPDRSITAAVCLNQLTDAASSEARRFELIFSDTSLYTVSEVPEFVLNGKYNSKLKECILF